MSATDKFEEAAAERLIDLERLIAGEFPYFRDRLIELENALVALLRASAPDEPARLGDRINRLKALTREADAIIGRTYSAMERRLDELLGELGEDEGDHIIELAALLGFMGLKRRITATVAKARARDILIMASRSPATSGEWWMRQRRALREAYRDELRAGLIAREPLEKLIARIRGTSAAPGPLRTTRRAAETLIRTSIHAMAEDARLETYRASPDKIRAVQATNEAPVTAICQARAGRVWRLDDPTFPGAPPWHPNCKSFLVPVMWGETPARGRTAREIFAAMDADRRAKIVGKGKWELLEKKKITWADLIDGRGRPLTLKELRRKAGVST